MKTIFTIMKKTELRFSGLFVFYLVAAIILAVAMVFTNRMEGNMAEAALLSDIPELIRLLTLITALIAIRLLFSGLSTLFAARFAAKANYNLRRNFIEHFLRAPFSTVEKTGSGEILSVYSNDIGGATTLVTGHITSVIEGVATFIASVTFLLMTSLFYTGVLVVSFLFIMLLIVLVIQPLNRLEKKASEQTAKFNAVVNDSLQNTSLITAYSLEDVIETRYMSVYAKYMTVIKKVAVASIALVIVAFLGLFGPLVIINVIMAFGVIEGSLSIPEFLAYIATIMMVVMGLSMIGNGVGAMASSLAHAKRVIENIDSPPEEIKNGDTLDTSTPMDISFENVSFSYIDTTEKDEDEDNHVVALDEISFKIKAGSRVAFVGKSGSGKSTILKLLLGLYEPDHGKITIGDKDITTLSKNSLREISAYVPQDSFLLPESIGENITLEKEQTDINRLEKACIEAGILDFIQSLPDKFDSVLLESSENISGGQRQRIALARAFYKDAPIILFDEATSSLDPNTEATIIDSLDKAAIGKTVIMVAHRTRAIAACDIIVVMDAGKIVGIGSHDELLESNVTYRNLEVGTNV